MFLGIFVGVNVAGQLAHKNLLPLPGYWLTYVAGGLAVMWIGIGIRAWSFATLGTLFTYRVTIQPGHRLVRSGPYRYVRHPSYTGLTLFVIGDVLALRDGLALLVLIATIAPVIAYRIYVEEKALMSALGDEYREYARTTKRLVPAIL
jgi:protein-S-isoprenylcysteine O-methyltransferase Ste14